MTDARQLDSLRRSLCALQDRVLEAVLAAQRSLDASRLAEIAEETEADTIFRIDRVAEGAIVEWLSKHWPADQPAQFVMEGLDAEALVFPEDAALTKTRWKCILDPIDGTRGWMYDKRSAWCLSAIAPQLGDDTRLSDVAVAAMTELPTSKQWRADQLSAVRGAGVVAEALDVTTTDRRSWAPRPSTATDFRQGFAGVSKFFPQGKALLAGLEEAFWEELHGREPQAAPLVFDDQYVSTGGQIYELASGRDRMWADLRPLAFKKLGFDLSLACHPYDVCTALILEELGGVVEKPWGGALDAPLDTTTSVAWIGYANQALAELAGPALRRMIDEHL